jgi:integrase
MDAAETSSLDKRGHPGRARCAFQVVPEEVRGDAAGVVRFPFGKPQPTDPARPATTFKTVWAAIKDDLGLTGRWHDNRHTFITDLAESGEASDETIRDMAGHVSKQMLKHYSHIRMEAKRRAVDALLVKKPAAGDQSRAFSALKCWLPTLDTFRTLVA